MMTLSDAIRLGSLLVPQRFDDYFDVAWDVGADGTPTGSRQVVGACAMGAAALACGESTEAFFSDETELDRRFGLPYSTERRRCPVASCTSALATTAGYDVYDMVPHLNDEHRWTREQIAEWVARVETEIRDRQSAPAPETAVAAR